MVLKLVIVGALGRMGRRLTELAREDRAVEVVLGVERALADASGGKALCPITANFDEVKSGDVLIDFSAPEATMDVLDRVVRHKKPLVIGTTGFSAEQEGKIAHAAKEIPVVVSFNMSLGVNVFFKVAQQIAKALPGYSVHIQETHHSKKKDAPSGTALQAGRLIEKVAKQKVTYESFREGDVVGDHRIIFKGPADRLELFHHAESRDIFAVGALQAAKWVAGKKPGLYSMQDVLGL